MLCVLSVVTHNFHLRPLRVSRSMIKSGVKPTVVGYTSAVSALSHCGEVERAMELVREMKEDAGVEPNELVRICRANFLQKRCCGQSRNSQFSSTFGSMKSYDGRSFSSMLKKQNKSMRFVFYKE